MDSDQSNNLTLDFDDDISDIQITLSDITSSGSSAGLYTWDSESNMLTSQTLGPITIGTGGTGWNNTSPSWTFTQPDLISPNSGKLSLKGDNADIDVNGVSLMDTLKNIQERLNILRPDPDMEAEWDELRALREQYEAKLVECREKSRMWKTLTSMPPPVIE